MARALAGVACAAWASMRAIAARCSSAGVAGGADDDATVVGVGVVSTRAAAAGALDGALLARAAVGALGGALLARAAVGAFVVAARAFGAADVAFARGAAEDPVARGAVVARGAGGVRAAVGGRVGGVDCALAEPATSSIAIASIGG